MRKRTRTTDAVEKPIKRSALRIKLGTVYYGLQRYWLWLKMRKSFVKEKSTEPFVYQYFSHRTLMLRKLKDVDM